MTRRHRLLPALAAAFVCSCGQDPSAPTQDQAQDLSCEAQPDPLCEHPLNELLIPELRALGVTPQEAAPDELCRRLSVDLVGRIPTPEELALCQSRTPDEMVDSFLSSPEYEAVQLRQWAQHLGYRVGQTVYWQIFELDELVAQLIRGQLDYATFARQAIIHPGFFASRLDGSWAAGVFNVFLGRPPRRDEMDGLAPLSRQLQGRAVCDGPVVEGLYEYCLMELEAGVRDEPCERSCEVISIEGAFFECGCSLFEDDDIFDGGGPSFGCAGDGLGTPVDLGVTECYEYELERLTDYTAGGANRCPERPEGCVDLTYDFNAEELYSYAASPLPPAPTQAVAALDQIGQALTARADFWEAAVDHELSLLLGWWKSGFRQPDFDRPAVRQYLADELRDSGDLRDVQRLVLTSLLYTAPAATPTLVDESAATELPPWSSGPIKLLSGERWLASASTVVGEVLGVCDHRFIDSNFDLADGIHYLSGAGYEAESTLDYDTLLFGLEGEQFEAAYIFLAELTSYAALARGVGGCGPDPAPRSPSLSQVANESDSASLLCSLGRDAVPRGLVRADTSTDALERIAGHLFNRALGRTPNADEMAALVDEMNACLDAGSCAHAEAASRWLCARLLDSSMFAIY